MKRIMGQRGWRRPAGGFRAGVIALCALTVLLFPVDSIHAQRAGADKPAIRVIGPLAAKEMVDALAANFAKGASSPTVDFSRIEHSGAAGRALLGGRDMMLCLGKVSEKGLGYAAKRWKALAPREHTIAAQAVAIVVHPRNAIESMTIKQLQAAFSGEARDWSVFGGRRKAIRRLGLVFGDPLSRLFHQRVLATARCRAVARKADSNAVLEALRAEPDGIAFVDAVAAASAGETVRVLGIDAGKSVIRPNAETIKEGSYPLAELLVVYVSPKASPSAKAFAAFIAEGRGDGILREHGFMPPLREVKKSGMLAAFEQLYGPDIKRVVATAGAADDLALAGQLIEAARSTPLKPELLAAMCESAYLLAAGADGGDVIAFRAADALAGRVPARRFDAARLRARLWRRAYRDGNDPADGAYLLRALLAAGEQGTAARRFAEAVEVWQEATALAEQLGSPRRKAIADRLPAFVARAESLRQAETLTARLRTDPRDATARRQMLRLQLLELDNPAAALDYVDVAPDEATRTNLPITAEPVGELSEDAALKLAEWYVGLAGQASPGGRPLLRGRAKAYYIRFFDVHEARDDALAMRAALGLAKIGGNVPDAKGEGKADGKGSKRRRQPPPSLAEGEKLTDTKLAAFVAAHLDATKLTVRQIGPADRLTDLRPLAHLRTLKVLELRSAVKVTDLSPLAELDGLESLTLTGLTVEDISPLASLGGLKALRLTDATELTDLSPIGRLVMLKRLDLTGCVKIADLKPLARLAGRSGSGGSARAAGLAELYLTDCAAVQNVAVLEPLAGSLASLSLAGTDVNYLMPLAKLTKLDKLDLRRCARAPADEVRWLGEELKGCKVLSDIPAKSAKTTTKEKW